MKQRMRSVKNIQKITSAMKMVAASKMRVAQSLTEKSRGLVEPFVQLLGDHPGVHAWACMLLNGGSLACADRALCVQRLTWRRT